MSQAFVLYDSNILGQALVHPSIQMQLRESGHVLCGLANVTLAEVYASPFTIFELSGFKFSKVAINAYKIKNTEIDVYVNLKNSTDRTNWLNAMNIEMYEHYQRLLANDLTREKVATKLRGKKPYISRRGYKFVVANALMNLRNPQNILSMHSFLALEKVLEHRVDKRIRDIQILYHYTGFVKSFEDKRNSSYLKVLAAFFDDFIEKYEASNQNPGRQTIEELRQLANTGRVYSGGDILDSELVHLSVVGSFREDKHRQVMSLTSDDPEQVMIRASLYKCFLRQADQHFKLKSGENLLTQTMPGVIGFVDKTGNLKGYIEISKLPLMFDYFPTRGRQQFLDEMNAAVMWKRE